MIFESSKYWLYQESKKLGVSSLYIKGWRVTPPTFVGFLSGAKCLYECLMKVAIFYIFKKNVACVHVIRGFNVDQR